MSDPSELTRERRVHAPEVMREAETATTTATAVMEPQLKEIKKDNWIKRLFSKKSVSRLIRIFKRNGKEYGLENTFEERKNRELQDFHERIQLEIADMAYASTHPAYNDFVAVMKVIDAYTMAGTVEAENQAIAQARVVIAAFIDKYEVEPDTPEAMDAARVEFLNRLDIINLMFETKTNGNLEMTFNSHVVRDEEIAVEGYEKWEKCHDKVLFTHEPCATDVQQRFTEDCYMMSSLSSLALMRPELIKDAIRDNGNSVTVRFYEKEQYRDLFDGRVQADCKVDGQVDTQMLLELIFARIVKGTITAPQGEQEVDGFDLVDDSDVKFATIREFLKANNEEWLTEIASRIKDNPIITRIMQGATDATDELVDQLVVGITEVLDTDLDDMERTIRRETDAVRTKMKERYVTVEKSVTKVKGTSINSNAVDCLWVQMIEKAYAASFNSDGDLTARPGFNQISRGNSYHFLTAFTGDDRYINREIGNDPDAVFDELTRRTRAKQVVTVASNATEKRKVKELNSRGIRAGHAYSVLGTTVVDNTKFVAIRDPYGLFTTSYDLKRNQTAAQGKKVSTGGVGLSMGESKGISYMEIRDFMSTFTNFSGILK